MPKKFSDSEREYLRKRLIEVAEECLHQYGLKKTSVDEIVNRTKIPKGTFYLFYASKELLFFDVFLGFHDRIHKDFFVRLEELENEVTPEKVTDLIFSLYKKVESSFIFSLFVNGELEMLFRKLPKEAIETHTKVDDLMIKQILCPMVGLNKDKAEVFSAALRAVFTSMVYRREIGEDVFDEALKIMIRGVVFQMFRKGKVT